MRQEGEMFARKGLVMGGRRGFLLAGLGGLALVIGILVAARAANPSPTSTKTLPEILPELRDEYKISVEQASADAAGIGANDAVERAKRELPFVVGQPVGMTFHVLYTDDTGEVVGDKVVPYFIKRPAWLVTFDDAQVPQSQPCCKGLDLPTHYTATVVAFIDSSTGEFLTAVTVAGRQ